MGFHDLWSQQVTKNLSIKLQALIDKINQNRNSSEDEKRQVLECSIVKLTIQIGEALVEQTWSEATAVQAERAIAEAEHAGALNWDERPTRTATRAAPVPQPYTSHTSSR